MITSSGKCLAFVLDIDGCLSKEGLPITGSLDGLKRLQSSNIPFVFCTNGGGQLESDRARKVSSTFSSALPFSADQVILSHTPLRDLVPRLGTSRVLIVGENCGAVARSYGFVKAEDVREFGARHPSLFPRRRAAAPDEAEEEDKDLTDDPVRAVLFFEDPEDLGETLQLVLDVLLTNGDPYGPRSLVDDAKSAQEVEVWFSNADLVYAGLARHPRLTQGSYRLCLQTLLASATTETGGRALEATTVGKPSRMTGEAALARLLRQTPGGTKAEDLEIWTVGDNPRSDVALAETMGWKSALVRTGIWDGQSEPAVKPTICVDSFGSLLDELLPCQKK